MRTHPVTLLLAALLAGSLAACGKKSDGKENLPPAAGPEAPPRVELPAITQPLDASAAPVSTTEETTGTTFPHAEAKLAPNASGVLSKIYVDEGDRVKKNDLLFRLRTDQLALYVKQAEAGLNSARVNLQAIKVEYDRTKRLFEQNAINRAAWDQVKAQYDGASAGVEQAKIGVAMAKKALSDAHVRSPISGVVTHKLANEGEMVTMMPPTIVLVVEDQSVLDLKFNLPERALATIEPGESLTATFASVGVTRDAAIARINPSVDPRTRTVEVVAELANADFQLKPGMLAKIDLGAAAAPSPEKEASK